MGKNRIGIIIFSRHTDQSLSARNNTRFVEEIEDAGYEADIYFYDLFSVFYKKNYLEIYYDNKKFNPNKYKFFVAKYDLVNYQNINNTFIIQCLNRAGIKVYNNVEAAVLAKNKRDSLFLLAGKGLPIIPTGINFSPFFLDRHLKRNQGKKIVAKTNLGSLGYGVSVLDSPISFISFMEYIASLNPTVNILIQPYVEARGEDYRVFVVGNKVIAAMKRKASGIEFRANISKGGFGSKIKPDKKMADLAIAATKHIGLDFAGVDIVKTKNKMMIVEVNANPGLEIEKITDVNIVKAIINYLIKKNGYAKK